MIHANSDSDQGWDRGWTEHKIRQLVRLSRMPFSEKLDWLENAHALAQAIRPSKKDGSHNIQNTPCADGDR